MYVDPINWEALATLAVAAATFLAVIGAWRLGKRQMDIMDQQTAIQEEQAKVQKDQYDIQAEQAKIHKDQAIIQKDQVLIQKEQTEIQREQTVIQARQVELSARSIEVEELKVRADLFAERMKIYHSTRKWFAFLFQHERTPGNPTGTLQEGQLQMEVALATEFMTAVEMSQFLFSQKVSSDLNNIWRAGKSLTRHQRRYHSLLGKPGEDEVLKILDESLDKLFEIDGKLAEIFGDEIRLTLPTIGNEK